MGRRKISQTEKDRRRRLLGLKDPAGEGELSVMQRNARHKAATEWVLSWGAPISVLSFLFALVFVLAPALAAPWRAAINQIGPLALAHEVWTTKNVFLIAIVGVGVALHFYSKSKLDGKRHSELGYPINLTEARTSENVIDLDLYPRTKAEERIFWVDVLLSVWIATFFWPILVGGFSMILSSMKQ